jgi:hypothetical protein
MRSTAYHGYVLRQVALHIVNSKAEQCKGEMSYETESNIAPDRT